MNFSSLQTSGYNPSQTGRSTRFSIIIAYPLSVIMHHIKQQVLMKTRELGKIQIPLPFCRCILLLFRVIRVLHVRIFLFFFFFLLSLFFIFFRSVIWQRRWQWCFRAAKLGEYICSTPRPGPVPLLQQKE